MKLFKWYWSHIKRGVNCGPTLRDSMKQIISFTIAVVGIAVLLMLLGLSMAAYLRVVDILQR